MRESFKRITQSLWHDWRIKWILGTPIAAILLSLVVYWRYPAASDPTTFLGAAFASWVSGLALTVAVTVVITFVTLARPEKEVFEARARNLLRRQTGAHIDYIIPELQKLLQPYCDDATRIMSVTEYNEEEKLFRISQYTDNILKSYLNDMPVTFGTKLTYKNGTPSPAGHEQCCLTFLKVNDKTIEQAKHFGDQIEVPFEMEVTPNANCRIEHRMVYWVRGDTEDNTHKPSRFTRSLSVKIQNQLPSRAICAIQRLQDGTESKVSIAAGSEAVIVDLLDLVPATLAYSFRLSLD